jgi:Domain of unknown function (DU1801)
MAANKTVETDASVAAFVANVADDKQRADADALIGLFSEVTSHPPRMWGPSIIGFDSYFYRYDSGREGTSLRLGFSPRKGQTVLYGVGSFPGHEDFLAKLGKHKLGKACVYIKRLSDIDLDVMRAMAVAAYASSLERHPPV